MQSGPRILIGTSGWHYKHWKGPFYPKDMKPGRFLGYYAERFSTAEINNSFYKLPEEKTLKQWKQTAGDDFTFSVKASRFITHMKKLKDPLETLPNFSNRVKLLGNNLGPVLYQLPPKWNCNVERLKSFLKALENCPYRAVFEFRDPSWFNEDVYRALSDHNAAFCIYDMQGSQCPKEVTADFAYIRLHGPGEKYQGQYRTQDLAGWAGAISTWSRAGKEIYCYFDNDDSGFAAQDALRLKESLDV